MKSAAEVNAMCAVRGGQRSVSSFEGDLFPIAIDIIGVKWRERCFACTKMLHLIGFDAIECRLPLFLFFGLHFFSFLLDSHIRHSKSYRIFSRHCSIEQMVPLFHAWHAPTFFATLRQGA